MRPVIGITGNYQAENNSFCLKDYYVTSISDAGGIAVILPCTADGGLIEDYLSICQGLLFSGGGDLDPVYWGEFPEQDLGEIEPLRDGFELSLARKAFLSHKAVLGICRGCQVLNVAMGGSLVQDINGLMSHGQKAPRSYPIHDIFIEQNSQLHSIMSSERIRVNSFHHQAVKELGRGLSITAMAADGTVEAIESREHPFYVGVQWHPECLRDEFSACLFAALTAASQIYPHF
ncbi:MAG: gamma-glutamyl-gamma-aminobutyrate hydrolase family protein [Syntrophomonas sp.]|nr:gamma-glutamyl-gamma-aminobutyrate hydrolase family protein [Syntrophomonas sp.]